MTDGRRLLVVGGPFSTADTPMALGPVGDDGQALRVAWLRSGDRRPLPLWLVERHGWEAVRLTHLASQGLPGPISVTLAPAREAPS